ncbi:hypothetical protein GGP72_001355 [Salinibacter ruber]|uniref:Uncharacterized protein n=1 Tax=Salinibacter ruber TaxID=146919 RepID=A0A9X2Q0R0_9BACT|nr:hypothetical protein [Salinibacter ruber]MCS3680726.1 hypothetical protein [Salinibacter ruber]
MDVHVYQVQLYLSSWLRFVQSLSQLLPFWFFRSSDAIRKAVWKIRPATRLRQKIQLLPRP